MIIDTKKWEKLTAKAGNGFSFRRDKFEKYIELPENKILMVHITSYSDNIPRLVIFEGKRAEWDSAAFVLDGDIVSLPLAEPQKRKNNNLLAKFTHDYPDEKILEIWAARNEKEGV